MLLIPERRHAMMRKFVDVEGKLGLDMLAFALPIAHYRTIFCSQLGKLRWDGEIGGQGMAFDISDVVGERAYGEGQLICVSSVAKQGNDEVAGPDVMSQVGERPIAEGIIPDILNDASPVRVGSGVLDF
jgi:hypothetical protein